MESDVYREALHGVYSYLMNYYWCPNTGVEVRAVAVPLQRLYAKCREANLADTMAAVAEVTNDVWGTHPDYVGFTDAEQETERLLGLPELGCRVLFDRFDAERTAAKFRSRKCIGTTAKLAPKLELAHEVIIRMLDSTPLKGEVDQAGVAFRFALRAMDTYRPTDISEEYAYMGLRLEQSYTRLDVGDWSAPMYQQKLAATADATDVLAGTLGLEIPERQYTGDLVTEYLEWIERELDLLEKIYVELVFRGIESMV